MYARGNISGTFFRFQQGKDGKFFESYESVLFDMKTGSGVIPSSLNADESGFSVFQAG